MSNSVRARFYNLTRNLGNVFGQAIASTVVVSVMVSQGFDIPLDEIAEVPGADAAFLDGWRVAHILLTSYAAIALALAVFTRPDRPQSSTGEDAGVVVEATG